MEKKSFMQFLDEFEDRFLVVEKQSKDKKKVEKKVEKICKDEKKKEEKKPVKKLIKKTEKKVVESILVDRAYEILDGITDSAIDVKPFINENNQIINQQESTADHAADLL